MNDFMEKLKQVHDALTEALHNEKEAIAKWQEASKRMGELTEVRKVVAEKALALTKEYQAAISEHAPSAHMASNSVTMRNGVRIIGGEEINVR